MSRKSSIEWAEASWNPNTGCTKISEGCQNCYAERMAMGLHAIGQANYKNGFRVTCHKHMLNLPLRWKKPHLIFVNSMGDLFHDEVPFSYIEEVFEVMNKAHWHCFQLLTKRAERLAEVADKLNWSHNIWAGVTVENQKNTFRIDLLRKTKAVVKFLSVEPLLGPIHPLDLRGIDWVIVGGESGPKARPMDREWVRDIRDQCLKAKVCFYFKQWGGVNKNSAGCLLDGKTWDQMPELPVDQKEFEFV